MTREEYRLEQAKFYKDKGVKDSKIHFLRGMECADSNPYIRYKDIEDVAKEVIDIDWQERQDRLWNMIERNLRAQFIRKACDWLDTNYEDIGIRYIRGEERADFIERFKEAMKGE